MFNGPFDLPHSSQHESQVGMGSHVIRPNRDGLLIVNGTQIEVIKRPMGIAEKEIRFSIGG